AEPGEAVGPGMPVLVIEDTHRLVGKVGVNERELGRVTPGPKATLVLDSPGAAPIAATVTPIAPAPGGAALYSLESPPQGQPPSFRPGTRLTVRFEEEKRTPTMRIPLDAIVPRDDKSWVFVISGLPDAKAKIREVTIDRADGKDVLVRSDLKDGDRIIREGAYFLLDGQSVRLLD